MNKTCLLCKRAFLVLVIILLILGQVACHPNQSNIDLSQYLGKTLFEIESALDVEFIDMSQYQGFENTFRAKNRDGEFDCVIDATGKVTRIHVLLSGKNGYSIFGVTSDMDAETANKILNQNSIYHVYDTVWCCANEADAIIQEGLGWSLEKNSAILEEALFLALIEENFTYQYDDSDGAYYIGNGQVVEYYYDSFPRFVYDYENLSAYQQNSASEILDGRYIAVSGTITGIDPDGKVTVFCEDKEAAEAAGTLLPMLGFAELYLTPEQEPLLRKLSVDDTILAFGRVDMSSYYSMISGIFQLESSIIVSVSGEDIEVPFIQTDYPGLTTFNEDGSTQEHEAGVWEDPSIQEDIDPMQQEYDRACDLLANGDYDSALCIFESLDDYKDSKRHVDGIRCINYAKQVSNAITSQYYSLRLVGINVSCEYSLENYTFAVTWEVPDSGLFGQLSSLGVAAGEEVTWSQEGCESQAEKVYYDYFMPEGYTGIVCEYNIRDMANDTYLTGTYAIRDDEVGIQAYG